MNILLTGGTGYIGSHTATVLSAAGKRSILLDNFSNSSSSVVDRLELIMGEKPQTVLADIRETHTIKRVLREHNIKAVIHFAGMKAVGESVADPLPYYSNNVQGTISLLKAMEDEDVRKLVFSSSATVYGDPKHLPIDEQHPLQATNPYGRTKLHVEEMLRDLATSDPAWSIACLRYFNPVGAHESGLIGELPNGIPNNLMPYISQVASGRRENLQVFGNDYETPDGTGIRDYIHVMDLAEGHLKALDFLERSTGFHTFNLGTGVGYSVLEVIEAYQGATHQSIPYIISSRRLGDVAESYANPLKANTILGWSATRNLHAMCASSWLFNQSLP